MSFENRLDYQIAVLIYKSENGSTPKYIDNLLIVSNNDNYNLRSKTIRNLQIQNFNTDYFKQSFTYLSVKVWNKLPINIRTSSNLKSFKKSLKSHMLLNQD